MTAISMFVLGVLAAPPAEKSAETKANKPSLAEVVKKVKENEKLYSTFEMRVVEKYTLVNPAKSIPIGGKRGVATVRSTTSWHVIQEGERFFQKENKSSFLEFSKEPRLFERVIACDGRQTRSVSKTYARLQEGRQLPDGFCHPNTLLYREWNLPVPFSKYLTMPDTKSFEMRWTVQGEEKVNDLRCLKLKFEKAYKDPEDVIRTNMTSYFEAYFWLAVDRNYLPVRSVSVTPRIHPELDHGIGEVKSLKEVKPGIWVPEHADYVANNAAELKKGMMIPDRHRDIKVRDVVLGKKYNIEVFRPKIPEGAKIIR